MCTKTRQYLTLERKMEFTDDSSEENPDEKRRTQQSGELRYAYSEGGYV